MHKTSLLADPAHLDLVFFVPGFFVGEVEPISSKRVHLGHIEKCLLAGEFREIVFLELGFGDLPALASCAAGVAEIVAGWLEHEEFEAIELVVRGDDFS